MSLNSSCKIILPTVFSACFLLISTQAFGLDQATRDLNNQMMMKIYDAILLQKNNYPELKNFDKSALSVNSYGIYSIQYKFEDPALPAGKRNFEFGVAVIGIKDPQAFASQISGFDFGFPLLELRISGFQRRTFNTRKFDVQEIVQKYGQTLWDWQQKYIPYQLKITPVKSEYKVGEDIEFKVTLTNKTNKNISVINLSSESLYFLYNNKMWGAVEVNPAEVSDPQMVLLAGQSIENTFRGPPMNAPQEFEIYVSYGLTYKGVKPSDILKIKVVE